MKLLKITITLMLLAMTLSAVAQTTRPRTSRTTARPNPTTAKPVRPKTIVAYEVRAKSIYCYEGYIVYAENSNNNPVVSINGENGSCFYLIKGKANVYENVRPDIDEIYIFPNGCILKTSKPMQPTKFLVWGDVKTDIGNAPELEGWESIKGNNGKYAFIVNKQDGFELWDMEELKCQYKWKPGNIYMPEYGNSSGPLFIASDQNVWYQKGDDVKTGPICLNVKEGRFYNYPLSNEEYVRNNDVRQFGRMRKQGDYLYVACQRRIYRMNMLSPGKWEEFLRIPPTEDNAFENFCITPNGDVLVIGKRVELYRKGEFDKPRLLGTDRKLKTGLAPYSHQEIWLDLSSIRADSKGNFVIVKDNTIYVYNPDGLVGFTDTYGKVVNLK